MTVQTPSSANVVTPDSFAEQGFALVHGLFSPIEAHDWRNEADRLLKLEIINEDNLRSPFKHIHAPYPQTIDPVLDISPSFRSLLKDDRVQHILTSLLGDEGAPFRDELHFHLPGTHNEPWRQDFAQGWDELPDANAITLLFQIEPADGNYGRIEIYQNSHAHLLTPRDAERPLNDTELKTLDSSNLQQLQTEAGDLVILHCQTPHRNGNNLTTYPRRSLNLTFNALRNGQFREDYYARNIGKREQNYPGKEFL